MKYDDSAWTEPEPAGFEDGFPPDRRLMDKAYLAPPPGGWLTVGGTPEDEALPDGRLPPGHAPSVPVPVVGAITVATGTGPDPAVPAILHLEGTFIAGDKVSIQYECAPYPASGAEYTVVQACDADTVAVGFASYLRGGSGFTTDVDTAAVPAGADILFIPNEFGDGSVTISGFVYTPAADPTVTLDSATQVTLTGTFMQDSVITISVDVDGAVTTAPVAVTAAYGTAAEVANAFTGDQHLGAVPGLALTTLNGVMSFTGTGGSVVTVTSATYAPPAGGATAPPAPEPCE